MSRKTKTPKFNSVLEDFRKFAGIKVAEEQGDKENSIALTGSDAGVKEDLPAGGKPFGSNNDPLANRGADVQENLPDTKEPKTEEQVTKEVSASSKVAEEDVELVNSLLGSIKLAMTDESQDPDPKVAPKKSLPASEDKKSEEPKKEEESTKETPCKTASEADLEKEGSDKEIDEDVLAEKIANHFRNVSVGYELGKLLFNSLGAKTAEELPPEVAAGMAAGGAPVGDPAAAGGGDEGDEIAMILQAVQELVAEGSITEEQAQEFLVQLQAAVEGGGAPEGGAPEGGALMEEAPVEGEPVPEEAKMASEKELENAINAKVAAWVSEGKTGTEIEELVKQAAAADAAVIVMQKSEAAVEEYIQDKVASAKEQGATEGQILDFVKYAREHKDEVWEEMESVYKIAAAVDATVTKLKEAGKSESEIEEYLKQAAENDAKALHAQSEQESVKEALLNKVAEQRQEKLANVPPEIQQVLQALQALLESGQITEEEAMSVLEELGLAGDEGAAPAEEAPAEEAPAEEAPAEEAPAEPKEEAPEKEEE